MSNAGSISRRALVLTTLSLLGARVSGCSVPVPGGSEGGAGSPNPPVIATGQPPRPDDGNYMLPWQNGSSYWVAQGAFGIAGLGSHEGQYAIDFVMTEGTRILAARAGRVLAVRESCPNVNCPFQPETCCGNYIKIAHADGSIAAYWHLPENGSCVQEGDEVQRGDVIGVSGNTGMSLSPHLHFSVFAPKGQRGTGRFGESRDGSMEVQFIEVPGDGVPDLFAGYESANQAVRDWCR